MHLVASLEKCLQREIQGRYLEWCEEGSRSFCNGVHNTSIRHLILAVTCGPDENDERNKYSISMAYQDLRPVHAARYPRVSTLFHVLVVH
jgi:hypothetical protein